MILTTGNEIKDGKKCSVPPYLRNKKVHCEFRMTGGSKSRDMYSLLPNGPYLYSDTHKLNLKQAQASVSVTSAEV